MYILLKNIPKISISLENLCLFCCYSEMLEASRDCCKFWCHKKIQKEIVQFTSSYTLKRHSG